MRLPTDESPHRFLGESRRKSKPAEGYTRLDRLDRISVKVCKVHDDATGNIMVATNFVPSGLKLSAKGNHTVDLYPKNPARTIGRMTFSKRRVQSNSRAIGKREVSPMGRHVSWRQSKDVSVKHDSGFNRSNLTHHSAETLNHWDHDTSSGLVLKLWKRKIGGEKEAKNHTSNWVDEPEQERRHVEHKNESHFIRLAM